MNKKYLIILISILLLVTISSVNASEKISATPNNYIYYYGYDQPAAETHSFAIEIDSTVYYISDSVARDLASYSPNFREAYAEVQGKSVPGIHEMKNDVNFDFEYMTGTVGLNNNAKIITKLYDSNGKEIN
ncbi:hypothetical protein PXD04_08175 [Methanosphaera sp. ISO3-F5]|uniref:hypothetical protein n=1 Tax=Methanosphaera sp. ISO3-F5 TaxID=1452353 RepID=UPI002B257498|nr:hypothetical protein [Methanosphaera sp. ISO3-F5]WQH63669.1 hypothetical protein PXD04_08175 [Methanosphaera sp. ISO3-F5]